MTAYTNSNRPSYLVDRTGRSGYLHPIAWATRYDDNLAKYGQRMKPRGTK